MKQFSCGDVVPGCKAVFRAESDGEVLAQVAEHAHRDHGIASVPQAMVDQVMLHMREMPAA